MGIQDYCLPRTHPLSARPPCRLRLEDKELHFSGFLVAQVWDVISQDQIQLLEIWKAGVGRRPPLCCFCRKVQPWSCLAFRGNVSSGLGFQLLGVKSQGTGHPLCCWWCVSSRKDGSVAAS